MKQLLSLFALLLLGAATYATPADADFEVRGIHLDMRTQVMTLDALRDLVREAAADGINTLLMEWEATFPFEKHATLRNQYAYTPDEVRDLVAYCHTLGIEVIPLQNCFGHCEYILRHPRYAALREDKKETSQVCPLALDATLPVFREIFAEIAAAHPSPYIHIGGDETRLLGHCKQCAAKVKAEGVSALFVDYVNAMCQLVRELGKQPIIWADMLLQHPEAVEKLPKELIVIDWNYGWEPTHFGDIDLVRRAGITVWGASALRSSPDNLFLTNWKSHFENLTTFLPFARTHGYRGMINTSWSTSGQYGYLYDHGWEVIDMQPIREVYPLAAFRILRKAYAEALRTDEPFAPEPFIRRYATEHLGLDATGAATLLDYFLTPQERILTEKTSAAQIDTYLHEGNALRSRMAALRPRHNAEEVAAWLLMLDIRLHYLRFKAVECHYESPDFRWEERAVPAEQLRTLQREGRQLQKRFVQMHAAYLKAPAVSYGAWSYLHKIDTLYNIVK